MHEPNQLIDWDALALSVNMGDCILMIGPDAIMDSSGSQPISIMQSFSNELIKSLPKADQEKTVYLEPAQVGQIFKNRHGLLKFRSAAQKFFNDRIESSTPFLKTLASLPFQLVIDTTPLRHMEMAFEKVGKTPLEDWYHKGEPPRKLNENFNASNPLVYHLFGSINDLKSLSLTENDFVDLVVSVVSGDPPLPTRILSEFSSECSMLFVGFGVPHFLLRILLHSLKSEKTTIFALERFEDRLNDQSIEGFKLFFKYGQRVDYIDMELEQFAQQLSIQCNNCIPTNHAQSRYRGHSAKPPFVFISYCHKDEEYAKFIKEWLEKQGILVWRDKENLRAGEDWNQAIRQLVQKVDYFVLLLSKTLYHTKEGYVIKEINCAMDRKEGMVEEFIIPASIDSYDVEDANRVIDKVKKEHHIIDVKEKAGLERLSTDIKRCYQTKLKTVL